MAYTDDAVLAKLSALNETHDSIATAAQWIMFHRRHAERTVQLWFQRLKDSPSPKRLNLVYLANEVTQQSKARHKDDFVVAFAPVIAEALAAAYKGAPSEVQTKLRRVVEVWRERNIFELPIQAAVESRIEEFDKAKGASRTAMGGSIFGGSSSSSSSAAAALPQELAPLVAPQRNVTKLLISTQGAASKADAEFDKIMNSAPPAAPVYAARLNGLLKTIADGEDALAQMVRARMDLKSVLDNLQAQYQKLLEADRQRLAQLAQRRVQVDERKRQVEDKIMRDLSGAGAGAGNGADSDTPGGHSGAGSLSPVQEPPRPEVEALTPPSTDPDDMSEPVFPGLEPPPPPLSRSASGDAANDAAAASDDHANDGASSGPPQVHVTPAPDPSVSGIAILSSLAAQAVPVSTNGANKRRRIDSSEEVPDLDDGIDADVAEMLRKDSQS
ncbi:ABC multidrug transporter mdr2 [Sporothrix brasiliensis 5110]|uniref:ABC multidrug transporter mdr2 n=1 Tax=Sporothrix brasiliensis 5110 TaxID=1398154 RepID=A0A0C2EQS1_9PEZI|nr:ABC multidrug transporter mdr2 [Sporothrix brasiliensis 5110]KIH88679.1 ABC multidrug transporter mdr2 [Sporothrix brasiliensis 5110]